MKALVLKAYNELAVEEVPTPEPGPGELLVHVRACGICGSDVHGMDGSSGRRVPPIIMGHEAAGTVEAVGNGPDGAAHVQAFGRGDRITFDSTVYCGHCTFCRRGLINLCDNRRVLGVSCTEYRQDGAFAEYVVVPERVAYRLPESVSYEQAAMVEPLTIACHAVELTPLRLGDTAVVVGAGMIGLLVIQLLRAAGAGRIVAVDVARGRLDLARRLGADEAIDPEQSNPAATVELMTGGHGADVVIEAVGISDAVRTAFACVRKGGNLTLVGNVTPTVELPLQAVVTRQVTVRGSCASCGEIPACLEMIARGAVDVDPLITVTAPLEQGPAWFDRLARREPGLMKVILTP